MRVRRATASDTATLGQIAARAEVELDVAGELARDWARLWVAEPSSGTPSAFLLAWDVADELHLNLIATEPSRRRKGAARALMAELLRYAADQRKRVILLEVRRSNRPAIRLYRSHGFSAIRLRSAYYADGTDALEMVLSLDPETGEPRPAPDEIDSND